MVVVVVVEVVTKMAGGGSDHTRNPSPEAPMLVVDLSAPMAVVSFLTCCEFLIPIRFKSGPLSLDTYCSELIWWR